MDAKHRALRDAARLAARPRDHSGRRPYLEAERQPAAGSGGAVVQQAGAALATQLLGLRFVQWLVRNSQLRIGRIIVLIAISIL